MPESHHREHAGHSHTGHAHVHAPKNFGPSFAIATALNVGLVVAQVFYGITAHSVALLADAGHNFGDALGLLIAWGGHFLAKLNPTSRYTYGFRSASILAALLNGGILLVATGGIAWEAIGRLLSDPGEVAGVVVMVVAGGGILVNGISAWLLMAGQQEDINIRGAFLHMLGDAGISFGVVLAGAIILFTGWNWLDPTVSILIAAAIVWGTWGLLKEAVNQSLDAVPASIDPRDVSRYLNQLPGVASTHDLHIWAMSTTETALTCHVVMPEGHPGNEFLNDVGHQLADRFGIAHPTLQIEVGEANCKLAPEHVV